MPNWKKLIVSGSSAELTTLKITGTSGQSSEGTSLMINSSGVVGTRELGSNAFNSNTYNNYSLPLGSSSTRGGFKIGYSESGKNYPVELSSEKMYVNVPWTDNNTQLSTADVRGKISATGNSSYNSSTGVITSTNTNTQLSTADVRGKFSAGSNVSITDGVISSTDTNTNTVTSVRRDNTGTYRTGNINLVGGTNVSISEGSAGVFTITSTDTNTDTNTTYSAGSGLGLSGTTFSHSDTSGQASVNGSGRTYIQDITLDTYGHVTGLATATETVTNTNTVTSVRRDNTGTYRTGNINLVGGTNVSISETSTGIFNISSTDTNTNTTYSAGSGLTLSGTSFSHTDTSSQSSVNGSGRTYIQDITLDTYGHVTGLATATETVTNTNTQLSTADVRGKISASGNSSYNSSTGVITSTNTNTVTSVRRDNTGTYRTGNINLVGGTNVSISEGSAGVFTITSTDTNTDTNTQRAAGGGLTLSGNTLSHTDTSGQASVNGSGRTYIQDITLDTYGHVTGLATATETVTNTDTNTQLSTADVRGKISASGNSQYNASTGVITSTNTNTVDMGDGFKVQDGDGTNVTITENKYLKFAEGTGIDINFTDTNQGIVSDPFDLTITNTAPAGSTHLNSNTTKADVGLSNVANESRATILASAALTGNPTAPTQGSTDNSTKLATTAFVQREMTELLGGAPAAYDTLLEISASIANGDSDVVALTSTVSGKLSTSGKAADSNLLDGLDLHTGRNNEVNKVVRTNSSGYIDAGWINTTSGATTTTPTRVYCSNDGYIRYMTPANFRAKIISAGTNVSISSAGVISSTDTNTDTNTVTSVRRDNTGTYRTGNINLVGGTNVSISEGSAGVFTITSTDTNTNTTYSAGSGLGLSGTTFSHSDTSSQSSVNGSGRTYIQDITLDTYGHVTGLATATETVTNTDTNTVTSVRRDNTGTYRTGNINLVGGTNVSISEGSAGVFTITSTDTNTNTQLSTADVRGKISASGNSSYNSSTGVITSTDTNTQLSTADVREKFSAGSNVSITDGVISSTDTNTDTNTVTSVRRDNTGTYRTGNINLVGGTNVTISEGSAGVFTITSTDTNTDTNTQRAAGGGLTLSGNTLSHTDTSSQSSVNGSGRTYIQDITLDTYGHVTGLSTATETVTNTDTNTQLSTEAVQDIVGAMFSGNTETRIAATYQDGDGTIDLTVDNMTANTQLSTADVRGKFEAGTNVTIEEGVISSTDTNTNTQLTTAQVRAKLSAGTGITYNNSTGVITNSVTNTNTTYSAGSGLGLSGTTFSNTGVLSLVAGEGISISAGTGIITITGTATGTLTGNGTSGRVPIYNGSTSFTTDSGFTYSSNKLSIDGTLRSNGVDIISNTSSGTLLIGDTTDGDTIEQIKLMVMAGDNIVLGDGETSIQSALYLTSLSAQNSEGTALMINGSNVVGKRELGSNAFNSTSFTTNTGTVTATNGSSNRVATFNNSTQINGESNMTYDGSTLNTTAASSYGTSGRIKAGKGTASNPGLGFVDDANTGFFIAGGTADTLYGVAGANNRWQLSSTGVKIAGGSLGVNVNGSSTDGRIDASNDIVAYSSDKRLKENIKVIENPLDKLDKLSGFTFNWNEKAKEVAGFDKEQSMVGVFAQDVESVLPEAVKRAPFDNDGEDGSISGENYLTVQYEKIVPLLIESIKELKSEIEELKRGK